VTETKGDKLEFFASVTPKNATDFCVTPLVVLTWFSTSTGVVTGWQLL